MNQRFTLDGSDQLEQWLQQLCDLVLREVRWIVPAARLEALLLGGGYGRGEGGVWRASGNSPRTGCAQPDGACRWGTVGNVAGHQDRAYNDLEFYVLVRGNRRRYRPELHRLAESVTAWARIDVELQLISAATLRRHPVSMFYHDLVVGHRWLWGDQRLLNGWQHHREAAQIPRAEATRLLVNRCTGLLLARHRRDEPDFVGRNIAKAQLALGDVILTVAHQYHASCRERHRRLLCLSPEQGPASLPAICELHAQGVAFKLHPHLLDDLDRRFAAVSALAREVWVWLEHQPGHELFCWREWGRAVLGRNSRQQLLRMLPQLLWQIGEPALQQQQVNAYQALWLRCR